MNNCLSLIHFYQCYKEEEEEQGRSERVKRHACWTYAHISREIQYMNQKKIKFYKILQYKLWGLVQVNRQLANYMLSHLHWMEIWARIFVLSAWTGSFYAGDDYIVATRLIMSNSQQSVNGKMEYPSSFFSLSLGAIKNHLWMKRAPDIKCVAVRCLTLKDKTGKQLQIPNCGWMQCFFSCLYIPGIRIFFCSVFMQIDVFRLFTHFIICE